MTGSKPAMPNDLSKIHQPISDWFKTEFDQDELDQYRLSAEQIAFFNENGYLAGIDLLTENQIQTLRDELAELAQPAHDGKELWYEYNSNEAADPNTVLFHALGAWRLRTGFHDLLWNPAFLVPASQLLGGSVRFWHDQLFCKPARHGGIVAWHQDYSYWTRTEPMEHLTCWIGLDESTRENGCLRYVPGSHRWELLPITGLAGDMEAIEKVLSPVQWQQLNDSKAIELRAGQCSFHHPLMVHGSLENRTESPRRAAVLNVVRDGVTSASDEPLLAGVDAVPKGEPLKGQFFPLLFESAE